jgi:hypothetical protein
MSGQFGVKPGTQAPEGMGMIGLDLKHLGELVIDSFDHLTNAIQKSTLVGRELSFLITARQRQEADTVGRSSDVLRLWQLPYKTSGDFLSTSIRPYSYK